jgi:hypothetical protein
LKKLNKSDVARSYFAEKGLSYESVSEGDIGVLFMLLNKHVKQANKAGAMSTNTMRMSAKIKGKYNRDGSVRECYLYINSHYFTQREAISFNPGGFIGFAGWADEFNKAPLISAFLEWVDTITN